jgi:methionyl-tRNA formyltransferase
VDLLRVQRAGKAAQTPEDMLRGFPLPVGTVLAPSSSEPPSGER